jgi:hypothetical protein
MDPFLATILGGLVVGFVGWLAKRAYTAYQDRKSRKAEISAEPEYPVKLTCTDASDYHPSAGFHEGYKIEVFNHSDKPVTVNGFGLDLTLQGQAEYHRYEHPIGYSFSSFPIRVPPNDGLDGYIDAEALSDQVFLDGEADNWIKTEAYVDLIGFGMKKIDPDQSE